MSQAATETESGTATSDTERSGSSHPTSRKSEYHPRTGSDDGDVSYFDESEKHRSTRSQAAASGSFYSRTGRYPPPAPPRPFGKDDSEQALMKKGQKMNPGDKVSVATSRLKMLRILEDPEQTRKFVNQAREQHSAENVELWLEIRSAFIKKYKSQTEDKDKIFIEDGKKIYAEYIRPGARNQVNMRDITRNQLKIALEKGNTEAVRQIFEELQETTLKQMVVDLLPRFNAIVSSHSEGTCEDQSMDTVDSEEGASDGRSGSDHGDAVHLTRDQACNLAEQLFTKSSMAGIHRRRKLKGGDIVAAERLSRWVRQNEILSGFLMKRGDQVPSWKRRFFVLAPPLLVYYHRGGDDTPRGAIRLNEPFSISTEADSEHQYLPFFFMIRTPQRCYMFQADSGSTLQRWIDKLDMMVK